MFVYLISQTSLKTSSYITGYFNFAGAKRSIFSLTFYSREHVRSSRALSDHVLHVEEVKPCRDRTSFLTTARCDGFHAAIIPNDHVLHTARVDILCTMYTDDRLNRLVVGIGNDVIDFEYFQSKVSQPDRRAETGGPRTFAFTFARRI